MSLSGSGLINLAKGKKAWLSSASKWSHPNDAWRAMDDDGQRDFSFHTGQEDNPWWLIDLEQTARIFFIVIGNRRKTKQELAGTITIEISNDLADWQMIHTGQIHWDDDLVWPLMGKVSGRFVRLSLKAKKTYLHLAKVEIWGTTKPNFKMPLSVDVPLLTMPPVAETEETLIFDSDTSAGLDKSNNQWLVDLKDIFPLETLIFDVPTELGGLSELKIESSRDGQKWQMIHNGQLFLAGTFSYFLRGEIIARYIRLSTPIREPLALARARVVAAKADLQVIHLRRDGLGTRLCSLMNAMYLAKILNCDMKFMWPPQRLTGLTTEDAQVFGLSFDEAVKFFEKDFCGRYLIEDAKPTGESKLVSQNKLFRRDFLKPKLHDIKGRLYSTYRNADILLNSNLAPDEALRPGFFFSKLNFHPDIKQMVDLARNADLPKDFTAIHLRSGDIVFREAREEGFCWVPKTVPAPLAKMVIEKSIADQTPVILFGEDTKTLTYLAGLYDRRVSLAFQYLPQDGFSEAQRSMFDLLLLSRSSTIYCGVSSYFSQCAQVINGQSTIKNVHNLFPANEIINYCHKDLEKNAKQYPALQAAFSYGYLYHLAHKLKFDSSQLNTYLDLAASFDPENRKYKILSALEFYKNGNDQNGELVLKSALNLSISGSNLLYDKPRCLTFVFGFSDFNKKHLEPLQTAAARSNPNACVAMSIICAAHGQKDAAHAWESKAANPYYEDMIFSRHEKENKGAAIVPK